MSEQILRSLIARRNVIKGQLNRFIGFITTFDDNSSYMELQERLEKSEHIWQSFQEIQGDIDVLDLTEDQLLTEASERETFENSFYQSIATAKTLVASAMNSANNAAVASSASSAISTATTPVGVKLPEISLPNFSGQYSQWSGFKDTFNVLIDNNSSLSKVQKFYYLKSALHGEAANVVQSLSVSELNYDTAWKLLQERFENKRIIIYSHIKALFELPVISKESYQGLRSLLDEYFKHIRALENLDQPTDKWDSLLIYLISTKLDTCTKKEWETPS